MTALAMGLARMDRDRARGAREHRGEDAAPNGDRPGARAATAVS